VNKFLCFLWLILMTLRAGFALAEEREDSFKIVQTSNSNADSERLRAALKEALREKSICLNMIVKNETPVIKRCLASVKPIIDTWVIVDTGSTDGTQQMIKEFMQDIPGELHERPWVNFEHNRNEALQLAKGKADYILFIDADEVLKFADNFKMPPLNRHYYFIQTQFSGTSYNRIGLVKDSLDWKWVGVLHEYIYSPQAKIGGTLLGVANVPSSDGARSRDPQKYLKDAAILEEALKKEPDNDRYAYYLAQSYMDAKEHKKALKAFKRRIAMGGWPEEVYACKLNIGHLLWRMDAPQKKVLEAYRKAWRYRPDRIEAPFYIANYFRMHGQEEKAYPVIAKILNRPRTKDTLFVQDWIYDYGLLFEYSIAAYWAGHPDESLIATAKLLKTPSLPEDYKEFVLNNRDYAIQKLDRKTPGIYALEVVISQ
jgi:glycosyltransferase involved in cell wall biosynthesis